MNRFIRFNEEPALLRKFEASYEDYMREVPLWAPRFKRRQTKVRRRVPRPGGARLTL